MKDFTLILWELENPYRVGTGYPSRGYPAPDKLVPAFREIGANFQLVQLCDYTVHRSNAESITEKEPFKKIGTILQSEKVLIEWDGVFFVRDYQNIWEWKKKLYIIPHDEETVCGAASLEQQRRIREDMIDHSDEFISELPMAAGWWKPFDKKGIVKVIYPPTRKGRDFDKMECRKVLKIETEYAIICWGNCAVKNYSEAISWIAEWGDTSLLFCGSGTPTAWEFYKNEARNFNVLDKIFISRQSISDADSDYWFSAADLAVLPERRKMGTSVPTYVIGQGKCCVVPIISPGYEDFEQVSGVIPASDLKSTTRELLLNPDRRKLLERKSLEYAKNNSYENYAIRIGKLMGYSYKKKR